MDPHGSRYIAHDNMAVSLAFGIPSFHLLILGGGNALKLRLEFCTQGPFTNLMDKSMTSSFASGANPQFRPKACRNKEL